MSSSGIQYLVFFFFSTELVIARRVSDADGLTRRVGLGMNAHAIMGSAVSAEKSSFMMLTSQRWFLDSSLFHRVSW